MKALFITTLRPGRGLSFGLSLILCLSLFTACKSQQAPTNLSQNGKELYNMNGKKILSDQFEKIDFFMGNYLVQKDNLKGLYDTSGKEILPCQFQNIDFYTGNYLVQKDNLKGLYDTSGKQILPCQFQNIDFYTGNYLVQKGALQRKRKRNHALQIQEHHDVSWRMAGRDVSNQKLRAIVFC